MRVFRKVIEGPHPRPSLVETAVSGVSVAGGLGDGLIRAPTSQVAWVKSVSCCGEPTSADKALFLDKLGAAQLQDIETSRCCCRGSALQGAQAFQLVRTVKDHAD